MSRISVFKFKVTDPSEMGFVHQTIGKYLNVRGFVYNREFECYETPDPDNPINSSNTNNAVLNGISQVLIYPIQRGFKYIVNGDEIIIKAYVVVNHGKLEIHKDKNPEASKYYKDLNSILFSELKYHKTVLTGTDIERINDGLDPKRSILPLIFIVVTLLVIAGLIYFALKGTSF